jgi:NTP pyrophosphatase (non-canonical NTP hydrolase)
MAVAGLLGQVTADFLFHPIDFFHPLTTFNYPSCLSRDVLKKFSQLNILHNEIVTYSRDVMENTSALKEIKLEIIHRIENYIKEVQRTINNSGFSSESMQLNFNISLFEEIGEFFGVMKKHIWHGHELNKEKLTSEAGDVIWYYTAYCLLVGRKVPDYNKCYEDRDQEIEWLLNDMLNDFINNYTYTAIYSMFEICYKFDITITEILNYNVAKLNKRYPDGFSKEKSINREN